MQDLRRDEEAQAVTRREFPAKVRALAFQRSGGNCEQCTARLMPGKFRYDHTLPDFLGGEPTLDNCKVLCTSCDGVKTYEGDVPRIAKTKRQLARHIGAVAKPRGFPKSEPQRRASTPLAKSLPPRRWS